MLTTLTKALLPRSRAATVQTLGHPAAGVIGWFDTSSNASGEAVTEATALNYSAVWCATRIISETIATLPCMLYRRTTDDSRERATDDDRYGLIHDEPHPLISAVTWFETLTAHMVLHGNCYARIVTDQRGVPSRLEPRLPDKVTPEIDGERMRYDITDPEETLYSDNMLHVLGLGSDGLMGWSVIKKAQQSIGGGMAADKQAARQFSNGAMPGGLLIHPMRLAKEAREHLRREWDETHKGADNSGKIGILHGGMDFKPLSMSNDDAKFLESRQFSIREIARWFRLPPHMLADLADSSVRANIEQQAIEFVVYSLRPWLVRWQQTLNRKLLSRDERREMYYEFLLDSLLSGDAPSRFAAYSTARQWGWLSVNDIRRKENMNTIEDGDIYLQPGNMVPAGSETQVGQSQVPPAIAAEMISSLGHSIDAIKDEARQMNLAVSAGLVDARTAMDAANEAIAAELAASRADRDEMRKDIAELGKVRVRGADIKSVKGQIIKAARRQRDCGESFIKWLDSHPSCAEELKERLLQACDGDREGFVNRIQAVLDSWE